jgi:hypothetical protein
MLVILGVMTNLVQVLVIMMGLFVANYASKLPLTTVILALVCDEQGFHYRKLKFIGRHG